MQLMMLLVNNILLHLLILLRIFTMNKGLVDVGQGCYVVYDGESG